MADLIERNNIDHLKFSVSSVNDPQTQHLADFESVKAYFYDCKSKLIQKFSRDPLTGFTTMIRVNDDVYDFYVSPDNMVNINEGICTMVIKLERDNAFIIGNEIESNIKEQVLIIKRA